MLVNNKFNRYHSFLNEKWNTPTNVLGNKWKQLTNMNLSKALGTFLKSRMSKVQHLGSWSSLILYLSADDFWGKDPYGDPEGELWLQGLHMVHCSYNSLWMGQIIHPDWDMFMSDHVCANFHAVSRAICGGPVYVSDSLGCHDFNLLKKLVYLDGTIPICQHFALPTRDCIFKSPLFNNTVLKIWNFNKVMKICLLY